MKENTPKLDRVFDEIVQIADPVQRVQKLDELCGNDERLRDSILDLLNRDQQLGSFLENPPTAIRPDDSDTTPDGEPTPPPTITNYRLVRVIGQGGMGTVWLAEQEKPVRREVALKLIRTDIGARQIISRFEAERQALALMDHPNISRVLGAGTTDSGQPYFVMEWVRGVPLNRYCDENELDIPQRLMLFVQVCKAVAHAHQKGIIHRDLKPSNVLVEQADGQQYAKVIDFGLAKAIEPEQKLTDDSLHTELGRVVGTLQYMSPEQADTGSRDIDTRTDIYSLGVILFELLTGSTPLRRELVREMSLLQVLEQLKGAASVRPSVRVDSSGDTISAITRQRQISASRLQQILRGELDWIVMKALETNRDLRYETANALSDDILRYLNEEPVHARPQSSSYRLHKFVQKHRGLVTAGSLILLLLIAGIAGTSFGFYQASKNAESERIAKKAAQKQKAIADRKSDEAEDAAEESRAVAKRASDALAIFSDAFQSVNPESWTKADMKAVDVLNEAKESLASSDLDDEGRIVLLQALSKSYIALAEYAPAVATSEKLAALREKHLGRYHADTVASLVSLGRAYDAAGLFEKAIPIYEEILKLRKASDGIDNELSLSIMSNMGLALQSADQPMKALKLFEEVVKRRQKHGIGDHNSRLSAMTSVGATYSLLDRFGEAIEVLEATRREAEQTGISRTAKYALMNELAFARMKNGETVPAVEAFEELLDYSKKIFGPDHRNTISSHSNLAMAYRAAGRVDESRPLLETVYHGLEQHSGPLHPDTLNGMHNLAWVYSETGNLDKAVPMLEACLDRYNEKLGPNHKDTRAAKNSLALAYANSGNQAESIKLFRQLTTQAEKLNGKLHPQTITIRNNLTFALYKNNQFEEVLEIKEATLKEFVAKSGPKDPQSIHLMQDLGRTYWKFKKYDKSIPLFERLVELKTEVLGTDALETLRCVGELGVNYNDSGDFENAIPMLERAFGASDKFSSLSYLRRHLREAYVRGKRVNEFRDLITAVLDATEKKDGLNSGQMAKVRHNTGLDWIRIGEPAEAEAQLRKALQFRAQNEPIDWLTHCTQSLLGHSLLDQEKFDEAEEMLIAGYEGLRKTTDEIPATIREQILLEALDRLIRLGRDGGNDELLTKYQSDDDAR